MSLTGSYINAIESLKRLEDFSNYSSCIRSFGKSIISPLLTTEQREEVRQLRASAVKKVADNAKKLHCASVVEYVDSCKSDATLHNEVEYRNSALNEENVIDVQNHPTIAESIFLNEMHISTCKIPTSEICSTVHEDAFVSPIVISTNNDIDHLPLTEQNLSTSLTDQIQDDSCHDQQVQVTVIPYKTASNEEISNASEDEPDSVTESTDFGSLLTVIDAGQFVPPNIENEQPDPHGTEAKQFAPQDIQAKQFVPQNTEDAQFVHDAEDCNEQPDPHGTEAKQFALQDIESKQFEPRNTQDTVFVHDVEDCQLKSQDIAVKQFVSQEIGTEHFVPHYNDSGQFIHEDTETVFLSSQKEGFELIAPEDVNMPQNFVSKNGNYRLSIPRDFETEQFLPDDTDNESNITCVTQSTDLEKYLDTSIEYSSTDDGRALSRSQVSSRLNMSTKSDNASSETLVNTGSESTPCASAMALFRSADGTSSGAIQDIFSAKKIIPQRANSVDSYMAVDKVEKTPMRKTQSEPPCAESTSFPDGISFRTSTPDLDVESQMENLQLDVSDSEVILNFEEAKKTFKRKHVRTNSYTLDHPSPALVTAHAGCGDCSKSSPNLSPHSCSSDKVAFTPPNPAFRKERVYVTLPPPQDLHKHFPLFSLSGSSVNQATTSTTGSSKMLSVSDGNKVQPVSVTSHQEESASVENSKTDINQVQNDLVNLGDVSAKLPNEIDDSENTVKINQDFMLGNQNESNSMLLDQFIIDFKEAQKNRIKQFYEEKNKLWFQMQQDLREQERLIHEKLNAVHIHNTDGTPTMPYVFKDVDLNLNPNMDQQLFKTDFNPDNNFNRSSNKSSDCLYWKNDHKFPEVNASEKSQSSNGLSFPSLSLNINVPEFPSNIHSSQCTSYPSTVDVSEGSESILLPSSLSSSHSLTNTGLNEDPRSYQNNQSSNSPATKAKSNSSVQGSPNFDKQEHTRSNSEATVEHKTLDSTNSTRSLYNSCRISALTVPGVLSSDFSSSSFRSSSQNSDTSQMFWDYHQKENSCPTCLSIGPDSGACINHEHEGNVCPECRSCIKCNSPEKIYCDYFGINIGNGHFTTPIFPSEFIPLPSYSPQQKSLPSVLASSFVLRSPSAASSSLENGPFELILSEPNSQHDQSCLHRVPKTKQSAGEIIMKEDKINCEEEIRTINEDLIQSYMRSYCQLKENSGNALIANNNSNRAQTQAQNNQKLSQVSINGLSTLEKGNVKENVPESVTNSKRRKSVDIVKDPILLKKFEKLPAFVKGYLTRRLFKTEPVQDLITTMKDTALLDSKFCEELTQKGESVSENEMRFHCQLISQLMKTFNSFYDIFCTKSTKEQMKIISDSRNFRLKKKLAEMKESEVSGGAEKCQLSPRKKPKLSAGTIKALERRRASVLSKTYTVENLKNCKPRSRSLNSTKSLAASPYKSSNGTSPKRKTGASKMSPWK